MDDRIKAQEIQLEALKTQLQALNKYSTTKPRQNPDNGLRGQFAGPTF